MGVVEKSYLRRNMELAPDKFTLVGSYFRSEFSSVFYGNVQ